MRGKLDLATLSSRLHQLMCLLYSGWGLGNTSDADRDREGWPGSIGGRLEWFLTQEPHCDVYFKGRVGQNIRKPEQLRGVYLNWADPRGTHRRTSRCDVGHY